jgi:hypothetical protein
VDFLTSFEWWKTNPHDELVDGGNDRRPRPALGGVPAACGEGDCTTGAGDLQRTVVQGRQRPKDSHCRECCRPGMDLSRASRRFGAGAPPGIALCCFCADKGCRAAYISFLSGLRTWSTKRGCAAPQRA